MIKRSILTGVLTVANMDYLCFSGYIIGYLMSTVMCPNRLS